MQVETYEIEEVKTEHPECCEEAIRLIGELGLKGQTALLTPTETKTRCPYRQATEMEQHVFKMLCPVESDATAYAAGPIPLRVLQILAHAQSLGIFTLFRIWAANGAVKDPVLLAWSTKNPWESQPFLLARWGDELDAWPILVKKAAAMWMKTVRAKLFGFKGQIERDIDSLTDENAEALMAQKFDGPSYYGF